MVRNKYILWLISGIPIVALFLLHPSQLGKIGIVDGKEVVGFMFAFFALLVVLTRKYFSFILDEYHIALAIQFIFFLLFALIKDNFGDFLSAATIIGVMVFYSILKNSDELIVRSAKLYIWIMSLVSIGALVAFIGFYLGYFEHTFLARINSEYDLYLIGPSLTPEVLSISGIVRPSGPFTEPGQLGIHIVFALIMNLLLGCNRKIEAILLAGGIVTLSLGTYVALLLYVVLYRINYYKFLNIILPAIVVVSTIFISLYVNEYIEDYIYVRSEDITNFGNRGMGYSLFFENIHLINFFGVDEMQSDLLFAASADATAFGMFLRYGIIGGLIVNIHVIIFLINAIGGILKSNIYKRRILLVITCIVVSMLFHRPFVVMFSFYLLLLLIQRLSIPGNKLVTEKYYD